MAKEQNFESPSLLGGSRLLTKEKGRVPEIPYDILVEVLARNPAKSLMRFMCVCKEWYSTISDPKFAQLHRTYSQTRLDGNYLATLWLYSNRIFVSFNDHEPRPIELEIKRNPSHLISASQPLDGLVCLYSERLNSEDLRRKCLRLEDLGPRYYHHALVLNITTRKILHLPKTRFYDDFLCRRYFLGVDPVSGDYKVLNLCVFRDDDRPPKCEIYTLGTISRRTIENLPAEIAEISRGDSPTTCVNGAIYWLTSDETGNSFLTAFEFGKEVFRTTRLLEPVDTSENQLFAVGGRLLVNCCFRDDNQSELLFFDEKKLILVKEEIAFPPTVEKIDDLRITGISPTGEIVFKDDTRSPLNLSSRKVYLDLKQNQWREIKFEWPQTRENSERDYRYNCSLKTVHYNHVENVVRWRDVPNHADSFLIED